MVTTLCFDHENTVLVRVSFLYIIMQILHIPLFEPKICIWTYFTRNDYSSIHSERAMSISQMGRHRPFLIIGNQSIGMERHSKSNFMGAKITSRGFAAPHISRNFREITKILGVTFRWVFFLWIKTGQNHQHYVKVHVPEMKKYCDTFLWVSIQKKVRVDWKLRNHR